MPSKLLLLTFSSLFVLALCGFTKDGGYIGKYPGGCKDHDECPDDENCIHDELEELCPPGDIKNCRCIMGCVYRRTLYRYMQWKPLKGEPETGCMCTEPGRYGKVGKKRDEGGFLECRPWRKIEEL